MRRHIHRQYLGFSAVMAALGLVALTVPVSCRKSAPPPLAEEVKVNASGTLLPSVMAASSRFAKESNAKITLNTCPATVGFKAFCNGEVDIKGASRAITHAEIAECKRQGVSFLELPIGYDGIALVVHKENDWVRDLTIDQLQKVWDPEKKGIQHWRDLDPSWPAQPIALFAPGDDAETNHDFAVRVFGHHASPPQGTSSLYHGSSREVAGNHNAMAYMDNVYYAENKDRLRLVSINASGKKETPQLPLEPPPCERLDSTFCRPVFLYVNAANAPQGAARAFVDFYIKNARELMVDPGFLPLSKESAAVVSRRLSEGVTGSQFSGVEPAAGIKDCACGLQPALSRCELAPAPRRPAAPAAPQK